MARPQEETDGAPLLAPHVDRGLVPKTDRIDDRVRECGAQHNEGRVDLDIVVEPAVARPGIIVQEGVFQPLDVADRSGVDRRVRRLPGNSGGFGVCLRITSSGTGIRLWV